MISLSRSLKILTFNYCSVNDYLYFWNKKEQNVVLTLVKFYMAFHKKLVKGI